MNRLVPLLLLLSPWAAPAAELIVPREPVPDRFIVVLEPKLRTALPLADGLVRELAGRVSGRVLHTYSALLGGFAIEARREMLAPLLADARVAFIEQDSIMRKTETQRRPPSWGLDRIDQPSLPLDRAYAYGGAGARVTVYVVDTGVRPTHSEFRGRIGRGHNSARDRAGGDASDCQGHGTHVAGTVAGTVSGVAKQARIEPVRVLGCDGAGTNIDVIAGLDWIAQNAQTPAVVNMSLGGGASRSLDNAVRELVDRRVTVVVAAGNENTDACHGSPARAPEAITVAASDRNDRRASFSNKGRCVDLFAPGHQIASSWHTGDDAAKTISGTSMAAPHVAGAAALYLGARPNATPAEVAAALVDKAVTGKISDTGGSVNRLLQTTELVAPGDPSTPKPPPKEEKKKGLLCGLLGC